MMDQAQTVSCFVAAAPSLRVIRDRTHGAELLLQRGARVGYKLDPIVLDK